MRAMIVVAGGGPPLPPLLLPLLLLLPPPLPASPAASAVAGGASAILQRRSSGGVVSAVGVSGGVSNIVSNSIGNIVSSSRGPRLAGAYKENAGRHRDVGEEEDDEDELGEERIVSGAYAECCARASEGRCRTACLSALGAPAAGLTLSALLDAVQGAGCELLLHDPLFLCLVSRQDEGPPSGSSGAVLDAARLHCCDQARSGPCRRACLSAYRHDWAAAGARGALTECVAGAARANESLLASCLEEVDAPCRPARRCSGLSYCGALLDGVDGGVSEDADGGPSWFRACSASVDAAARRTAARWDREGVFPLAAGSAVSAVPLLMGVAACGPGLWRAVACLLHAQPCHPARGNLPLCLQVSRRDTQSF
ncbi:hypothetical protein ONE63_002922 [Megalurothrips usitatus]|uniref:Uncharacterized protein n=1 Tax=Megalurothrips usitatus TaxID=439358 RepID=A0AAV7X979_9NEOP|nr:hypothetical protein ONE63_002922 [Megalurothrips usitatus]